MPDGTTAARLLRELRLQRGHSLRAAAEDLGVAASHLSRLERGEKAPSPELVDQLAHYYRIDRDLLDLERGRVPEDIVQILREHPELLTRLRREYGGAEA